MIYELTNEDIDALYAQWTPKTAEKTFNVERAYKYEPNTVGYPNIFVIFTTKVTFKPMPQYSASIDWANQKIEKYWYNKNSAETADVSKNDVTYEIHANVPAVEDELRADADSLTNLFSSEFRGNDVIIASMVKSDQEGFKATAWTYSLVFDKSNIGKKFMGNDGKEYTLGVTDEGKTLTAKTGAKLPEAIAKLVLIDESKAGEPDEADYTQVVYQHGVAAEALLNYASHSEGLRKLILNEEKLQQDLENTWAVVAEAIQTILRREAYPHPYEALKALTRTNKHMTEETIHEFIQQLEVSDSVKAELMAITPSNYTGI